MFIVTYSTNKKGKSVIAETFIKTLKNKIYKYMTSVLKMCILVHQLTTIQYHSTIKMKCVDVKSSMCIDFNKKNNIRNPKFKISDHVRVLKYKIIFAKGYVSNWSEEFFVIKKAKNTVPWMLLVNYQDVIVINVINDLKGEEIIGTFYDKELQKANQTKFRVEKVIKRKGDKPFVKCKDFNNSFNNWIDKKQCYIK